MSAPAPIPAAGGVWSLSDWVEREACVGRVALLVPELLDRVGAAFDSHGPRRYSGAWPASTLERDALRSKLLDAAADALADLADLDARWPTGAHAAPVDPVHVDSRGGRVTSTPRSPRASIHNPQSEAAQR